MEPQKELTKFDQPTVLEKAVALFTPSKLLLAQHKGEFGSLKFTNLKDKPGIQALKEGHKKVKGDRIQLGKSLSEFIKQMESIKKEVKSRVQPDINGFKELESLLKSELDKLKEAQADAKKSDEEKALIQYTDRTNFLEDLGAEFDGANYILGTIVLDPEEIAKATEPEFEKIMSAATDEYFRLGELERQKQKDQHPDPEPSPEEPSIEPAEGASTSLAELPFETPDPESIVVMHSVGDKPEIHQQSYELGFDACRGKILARLNDPTPIKRGYLKQLIQELKY